MADPSLHVYLARDQPDLGPVFRLFEGLTGVVVTVGKIFHLDTIPRVLAERADPLADLLIMYTQVAFEAAGHLGLFDPYVAPIARDGEPWLHASDYSWLSFNAWPRIALINRQVLPDPADWPSGVEVLAEPRFRDLTAIAGIFAEAPVAQVSAMRAVKGDDWTFALVDRWLANGMRVYWSNLALREGLIRDRKAVALANSSNAHVFLMAGQPVGEAWLDQGSGSLGTLVEGHSIAILRGAKHPEAARDFIDFLLSSDIQTLLARLHGETPVNPAAVHGVVRPLVAIRRIGVTASKLLALRPSTEAELTRRGFNLGERG